MKGGDPMDQSKKVNEAIKAEIKAHGFNMDNIIVCSSGSLTNAVEEVAKKDSSDKILLSKICGGNLGEAREFKEKKEPNIKSD